MIVPRPYQRAAIDAIHAAATRGVRRPIFVLPTGGGKTTCFAYIIKERGGRALILAHRDELIQQAARQVRGIWPEARTGIVKAESNETGADVVVASVQTLVRPNRMAQLLGTAGQSTLFSEPASPFRTVIVDEVHHAAADSYVSVLKGLGGWDEGGPLVVGTTATPERGDDRGLGGVFEEIVFSLGVLDGIAGGWLCEIRSKQIKLAADFSKLSVRAGEFRDEETAELLMEANAPEHAAKAYVEHAKDRTGIVFTPTVSVAIAMADAFNLKGIKAEYVHGEMAQDDRRGVLARYKSGATQVVANCAVLLEGFDEPKTDAIVMARPTRSKTLALQAIGRGTRIYPGKKDLLVLDLVGSIARLDLVTVASLFEVDPIEVEEGVVSALAKRQAREREDEKQGRVASAPKATDGRLISMDVSLFEKRTFGWVDANGVFVLSLGHEGDVVLRPGVEPDSWDVVKRWRAVEPGSKYPRDVESKLYAAVPLENAQGIAEDLVRAAGAARLNDPKAPWRSAAATESQMKTLRGRYRPGMTKGEASDAITAMFAGRAARR